MGKITLSGAIPGDNNDGLGPHSDRLLDDYKPGENPLIYNVMARVFVSAITTKTVKGITYPVLQITHWELVPAEHQEAFGKMMGDAFGARTGAQELPFPDGAIPIDDPFPEADETIRAIENLENEPGPDPDPDGGGEDELSARRPRARRRS